MGEKALRELAIAAALFSHKSLPQLDAPGNRTSILAIQRE